MSSPTFHCLQLFFYLFSSCLFSSLVCTILIPSELTIQHKPTNQYQIRIFPSVRPASSRHHVQSNTSVKSTGPNSLRSLYDGWEAAFSSKHMSNTRECEQHVHEHTTRHCTKHDLIHWMPYFHIAASRSVSSCKRILMLADTSRISFCTVTGTNEYWAKFEKILQNVGNINRRVFSVTNEYTVSNRWWF